MKKILLALIISVAFVNPGLAKPDTTLYYMKNVSGVNSSNDSENAVPADGKDDATLIRAIISPNFVEDSLYTVYDYYLNGKIKFTGKSKWKSYDLSLEGTSVEFFKNGHKRRICTFDKGVKKGDILTYFPNGALNTIKTIPEVDRSNYEGIFRQIKTETQMKSYNNFMDSLNRIVLKQCQDSTGKILAENGSGKWIEYQNDYRNPFAEGEVKNGFEDGEWHGQLNDTINYTCKYSKGSLKQGKSISTTGKIYAFTEILSLPEFPGGVEKLSAYFGKTLHYTPDAREKRIQGRVILRFVIHKDGSLANIEIIRNLWPSLDAEALNALKTSPNWLPGYRYGVKTDIVYSIPVSFTLAYDN